MAKESQSTHIHRQYCKIHTGIKPPRRRAIRPAPPDEPVPCFALPCLASRPPLQRQADSIREKSVRPSTAQITGAGPGRDQRKISYDDVSVHTCVRAYLPFDKARYPDEADGPAGRGAGEAQIKSHLRLRYGGFVKGKDMEFSVCV